MIVRPEGGLGLTGERVLYFYFSFARMKNAMIEFGFRRPSAWEYSYRASSAVASSGWEYSYRALSAGAFVGVRVLVQDVVSGKVVGGRVRVHGQMTGSWPLRRTRSMDDEVEGERDFWGGSCDLDGNWYEWKSSRSEDESWWVCDVETGTDTAFLSADK